MTILTKLLSGFFRNLLRGHRRMARYTLEELLARSDYPRSLTLDEREWMNAPAVGRELL